MRNLRVLFAFVLLSLLLAGCGTNKNAVRMTVASEKRMAMRGVAPMEVYLVKEGDAKEWSFFYSEIQGFNYIEGIEYVLMVKKQEVEKPVAAGASSISYFLVDVVSETEKVSENMPRDIIGDTFVWTARVLETYVPRNSSSELGLKLEVTALNSPQDIFKEGDVVMAELAANPVFDLRIGGEYVFRAARIRGDNVAGYRLLGVTVQDLVK